MRFSSQTAAFLIVTLALVTPLAAQSRGAFTALPFGVVFNSSEARSVIRSWEGGLQASLPAISRAPGVAARVPDFGETGILSLFGINIMIDAVSTGNDKTPIWWDGVLFRFLDSWTEQWATVFLSISEDSTNAQGWFAGRTNDPGPGSELVGFYVDNTILPPILPGHTYLEHSIDDVPVAARPPTAGPRPDVKALDAFIPSIIWRGGVPDDDVMPVTDMLYFSLTPASAADVTALNLPIGAVDGATIFAVRWLVGEQRWSDPAVFKTGQQLGLLPGDNVDALGVGFAPGAHFTNITGPVIIFSREKRNANDNEGQLLVHAAVTSAPGGPQTRPLLRAPGGTVPLAAGITVGSEIDGICVGDPEGDNSNTLFGSPRKTIHWAPKLPMSFSMHRITPTGDVRCVISGWGREKPVQTQLIAYLWFPAASYLGAPFTIPMPIAPMRQANDHEFQFTIPINFTFPAPGLEVEIGILQSTGGAKTYPLGMFLY